MPRDRKVWVFAEVDGDAVAEVSLELVSKARELARALDGGVGALLLGESVEPLARSLIEHGCDEVHLADDPQLAHYFTLPYAHVIVELIRSGEPEIVLFGATSTGRDLAPRVASELRVGLTADCTDLRIGDHTDPVSKTTYENLLYQIRPAFGGNIIATIVNPETRPQMATVREGVMKESVPEPGRSGQVKRHEVKLPPEITVVELLDHYRAEKEVDLKGAHIIVAGGVGVGSKENFEFVFRLAHTLGGVVGASRAAVDAGFISKAHQVGQTGTTVRPKLYIACGISGAIQHRAGMQESGKIIAINKDPHAPIFEIAHYGIVGDLNEVIPAMIETYKRNAR